MGILNGQGFTLNANEAGGGTAFSGFSITDTRGTGVGWYVTSANGQSMGTYDFTAAGSLPWKLAITADEYAGTYYSTVATTVATVAL